MYGAKIIGATWIEPGVSRLTTEYNMFKKRAFKIGELDGTMTERIYKVKSILDLVGNTVISDNLMGIKWSKLIINVALSGMSAALGCTYGDVLNNKLGILSATYLADETIKVAYANGIKFPIINGTILQHSKGTGILTPYNDLVVKLVQEVEQTKSIPDFETNIEIFKGLIESIN